MIRAGLIVLSMYVAGCAATPRTDFGLSLAALHPQQILLTVKQPHGSAVALLGGPGRRYLQRREYGPTPTVERVLDQVAGEYDLRRVKGWPIPSLNVYCEVLEVPPGIGVDETLRQLQADPRVDLAQRMNRFQTLTSRYDDPLVDLQPGLVQLDIERAHDFATGKDVLVAVIDSAVDQAHPDLQGRVTVSRNLVDTRNPRRGEIHGTGVVGVIASTVNNSEGIVGIAPDVAIASLRACWSVEDGGATAECSSFSLAQALEAALRIGPQIINLSLAGPFDPLLSRLLDVAIQRGIIVVAAEPDAGDAGGFPTFHGKVIAAHAPSSAHSGPPRLSVAAPADEILTTTPDSGYSFLSGNSLAAAHVSGVVALLLERRPDLEPEQIAALLTDTQIALPGLRSINACRALARLTNQHTCAVGLAQLRAD